MRRHFSGVLSCLLFLFFVASCGGTPTEEAEPAAATTGGEELDVASVCAALEAAVVQRETQLQRAEAEARAEETGETPEEILAQWGEEATDDEEPPTWRCPASDPTNQAPQPALAPVSLPGGGSARILPIDRLSSEGLMRFVYLVVQRPGHPLHLEWIEDAADADGQEWTQIIVTALEGESASLRVVADALNCVPAGFDEESEGEPPSCTAVTRYHVTCDAAGAEVGCGRTTDSLEE